MKTRLYKHVSERVVEYTYCPMMGLTFHHKDVNDLTLTIVRMFIDESEKGRALWVAKPVNNNLFASHWLYTFLHWLENDLRAADLVDKFNSHQLISLFEETDED